MILHAKSLGVELESIPNQPYFTVVGSPGNIEVRKAAQLANMPVEEFRFLNPAYTRPIILHGMPQIVLPVDNVDQFHANLASSADPLVTWQLYKLKRGDTLRRIAALFNVSVDKLREVNGFGSRKRVHAGQILLVPSAAEHRVEIHADYNDLSVHQTFSGNGMRALGM